MDGKTEGGLGLTTGAEYRLPCRPIRLLASLACTSDGPAVWGCGPRYMHYRCCAGRHRRAGVPLECSSGRPAAKGWGPRYVRCTCAFPMDTGVVRYRLGGDAISLGVFLLNHATHFLSSSGSRCAASRPPRRATTRTQIRLASWASHASAFGGEPRPPVAAGPLRRPQSHSNTRPALSGLVGSICQCVPGVSLD